MFEAIGLDSRTETVYLALIDRPGSDLPTLVAAIDAPPTELIRALNQLTDLGLAMSTTDGVFHPLPPDLVIETLVANHEQHLHEARAVARRLSRDSPTTPQPPIGLTDIHGGSESTSAYIGRLVASAKREIAMWLPADGFAVADGQAVLTGRPANVDLRIVLTQDFMSGPGRRLVDGLVAVASVRLCATVPASLVIVDHAAAAVRSGQEAGEPMLAQGRPLIDLLRAAFNAVWECAHSLAPAGVSASTEPDHGEALSAVATLLADGLKDDALARHLRISPRSARRRIGDFLSQVPATTRFQAGYLMGRRERSKAPRP